MTDITDATPTYTSPTSAVATPTNVDSGVIAGSVVGATCGLIIIIVILVLVCCRWRKRSRKNLPPNLPHPFARVNTENWQPPRSSVVESPINAPAVDLRRPRTSAANARQADSEISNYESVVQLKPIHQTWIVQDPVIHSPVESSEDARVSYILMKEPSRPISMSPPSPELVHGVQMQASGRRPPPSPCKSPDGYVNVQKEKPHASPKASSQSTTLPTSAAVEGTTINNETTEDADHNDNYANFQNVLPSHKSLNSNDCNKESADVPSPDEESFDQSDYCLHEVNRKSSCYENVSMVVSANGDFQNGIRKGDDSSSDERLSSDGLHTPTSYVNVNEYWKILPGTQPAGTVSHESESSAKPASHQQKSKPSAKPTSHQTKSEHSTKPVSHQTKSEHKPQTLPKPASSLPKPKLVQPTTTNIRVHISQPNLNAGLAANAISQPNLNAGLAANAISQPNLNAGLAANAGQNSRGFNIPDLIPASDTCHFRDTDVDNERNPSADDSNKHSIVNKLQVAASTQGKDKTITNQNIDSMDVINYGLSSNNSDEEDRVYQNSKQLSHPEWNQSNNPSDVTNIPEKIGNIQKAATNVQQELNGITSKPTAAAARQSHNPPSTSRPHLQNTNFGSSPNVANPERILEELKFKFKKGN